MKDFFSKHNQICRKLGIWSSNINEGIRAVLQKAQKAQQAQKALKAQKARKA